MSEAKSTQNVDLSGEIRDGKNLRSLQCKVCNSIILTPSCGNFTESQFCLPTIVQKVNTSTTDVEDITKFWLVEDMFTFQNVGFSNSVDNNKFLTCADCDTGPIGYFDVTTKKSYVALSRVKYI